MSCPRCNAPAADETLREFGGVCPKCLLDFSEEQDAPAFPNLEIVEMLGQGGMGVVYKAVQRNLGRSVALKVLSPHLSDDPEFVERFTREARALASLSHPNIVGIYDSGIHDHVPYLVMEYVDGTPLRKMLASKKLTPERVLDVIPQICDALHYAHAHGVVHRDIKPENILVDREGRVKIADFGLAKLASLDETRITRTGYVMGSPHYMAPEQFAQAGKVDHRADIYSLGVVFYEMLTGEVPMGRFKPPSEKAPVDQRLDPVVLKSLEREPEDRWQSADEMKARVAGLDAESPESPEFTLMWNGIPILIVHELNPRELYGSTLTTVYVDGQKLGSGAGIFSDRVMGTFRDRQGREHQIEVKAGGLLSGGCKVTIDGSLVWSGTVPVQNSGFGCGLLATLVLGVGGSIAAMATEPRLLLGVIPIFILSVVALVVKGFRRPAAAPVKPPGKRKTKLLTVVIGAAVALGIGVALWYDQPPAPHSPEEDVKLAIGGPVLVIGAAVVTLVLLVGPIRGRRFRAVEPVTPARRQSMIVGIAAGGIAAIAIVILIVGLLVTRSTPPAPSEPAMVQRSAAPAPPSEGFRLEDAWPTLESLPRHLKVRQIDPKKAPEELGLDQEAMTFILEIRRWQILADQDPSGEDRRCFVTGIQFSTPEERVRWQKSVRRPNIFSDYCGGATMLWMELNKGYGQAPEYSPMQWLLFENYRAAVEREAARQK